MKFINPLVLVVLALGIFLFNTLANASPGSEIAVSAPMNPRELQLATDEWETILEILDAGRDKTAGPGGRATVCNTTGLASFYGLELHGHKTANGERFNANGISAAHRSLPFGTQVRVTSLATGRSVTVRINDRGPFVHGRIIDLSAGAARAIGISLGKVRMECV